VGEGDGSNESDIKAHHNKHIQQQRAWCSSTANV
jgi:hypothetical protein